MILWQRKTRILNKGNQAAKDNQAAQTAFYKTLTDSYNTNFAKFGQAYDLMMGQLKPIIEKGPDQYGFGTEEEAALRTAVTDNLAKGFQDQSVALENQLAARNGGENPLPSGAQEQIRAELAAKKAQAQAAGQNAITEQGYQIGREKYAQALAGVQGGMSLLNPSAFAGAANGAGKNASDAIKLNAELNKPFSWGGLLGGLAGTALSAFTGGITSGIGALGSKIGGGIAGLGGGGGIGSNGDFSLCWMAAATFDGWDDPRTHAVRNWLLNDFSEHWYGRLIVALYRAVGKQAAKVPFIVWMCRPLFGQALKRSGWNESR